jgi:hypothetical protein
MDSKDKWIGAWSLVGLIGKEMAGISLFAIALLLLLNDILKKSQSNPVKPPRAPSPSTT